MNPNAKMSLDIRKKISDTLKGKTVSNAVKDQMSEAAKKRKMCNLTKICSICNKTYHNASYAQKVCKECSPTKYDSYLVRKYRMSKSKLNSLLVLNNGMCWICLTRKSKVVDHCHKTGRVRGMLCKFCNICVTILEDADRLKRVQAYLCSDDYIVTFEKELTR